MAEEGELNEKQTLVDGEVVAVNVKCSNGSKFSVRTNLEATVESFKVLVAKNCDVPANQQRIIYNGRILKDDQTLLSYGLQADHSLHMVRGSAPLSAPPAANSGRQNPTYEDLMNTPAYQSLMNTPELMRILIMSNPQLRELVDHSPELGHILNDPSILRQTLEAARNPEIMREEPLLNTTTVSGNVTRDASNTNAETGSRVLGLGGQSTLGEDSTVGATQYASQMNQFLQNPAMSEMMQSLLSNPHYMNESTSINTQLRNMMDSYPQLRQTTQQNQSNVPREELYLTELHELEEMGFLDRAKNIRALRATYGNVNAAAARLEVWLEDDSD